MLPIFYFGYNLIFDIILNNGNSVVFNQNDQEYSKGISLAEFNKIKNGMTYKQVVEIIGGEGVLNAESGIGDYHIAIYSWEGIGTLGANANVTFENGKVSGKAQMGLK